MSEPTLESDYIRNKQRAFKEAVARVNRLLQQRVVPQPVLEPMLEPLAHLFANAWLRSEVHPRYLSAVAALSRNPEHAFLVALLTQQLDDRAFMEAHLRSALATPAEHPRHLRVRQLLAHHDHDFAQTVAAVLAQWQQSDLPPCADFQQAVRQVGAIEKSRYAERLDEDERARLALVDRLPDRFPTPPSFAKVGLIPRMACAQSCRHCMFVWRPVMRDLPDPTPLYKQVNGLTTQVLFTGGDLTPVMPQFYQAIRSMPRVKLFALLLNGSFAHDEQATQTLLQGMLCALQSRSKKAAVAQVVLQISFDEFHQEILADRQGHLSERIPVAHIARIVRAVSRMPEIKLSLLHKQNSLNFSDALFTDGVFERLQRALADMGESLQLLQVTQSSTTKRHPARSDHHAPVIREALMALASAPQSPIHWMSGTTDRYGRAAYLEPSLFINDQAQLERYLQGEAPTEGFDIDPMLWLDGHVSLFSASHITMGDFFQEPLAHILTRWRRDPLLAALARFDPRLLQLYRTLNKDGDDLIASASSVHHLFHRITETAHIRLEMTRLLAK
ncbi:hypothetical protein Mmc1_0620 [Magnetococcus marinus MC-1]|uniref:Radical SAM domain protein n=1 Tax=Magnetococcus marinus (strain ATCC BAA-1437 / JCM 17883 / MC-1) TaxID=156889 RepID=A0L598_MAGMM|nr:hypothetical protein [Magnetococcus marinus]ABK43141.1 hypothetical protein Mmc1_0620 [Magnetococcus marinus MC-1]